MRDVKPAEMTSWLCHLLSFDGQGLHAGARALRTFALWGSEEAAGKEHRRGGWRATGRWEGVSRALTAGSGGV